MLKFNFFRAAFFLSIASILCLHYFNYASLYWLFFPIVIFVAAISYGSYSIQSHFFLDAICCAKTQEKKISITFDDGPDSLTTPSILALLKQYNIKAVFFCIGNKIPGNENIIRQINKEGHVIGNHSYSHSNFFDFYRTTKVKADLAKASEIIRQQIGRSPKLFRPPFGVTNPSIAAAVKIMGFMVIGWNIRSLDTVTKNEDKIFERVVKNIKPGSVLLFHDTGFHVVEVIKRLIDYTGKNGISIVPLNELLNIEPYEINSKI